MDLYDGRMEKPKTPLDRAIDLCGGQTKLATKIGRSQQLISYWQKTRKGVVPAECARDIAAAVDDEVTIYDLRPDLFGEKPSAAA